MNKKVNKIYYIAFLIIYLELLTKIFIAKSINTSIYTLLFSIPIIILIYLITNIFKNKGNVIMCYILTIVIAFLYGFHSIFFNLFDNIFSFSSLGLAGDIGEFKNVIIETILNNIWLIFLYFIPLILLIIFRNRINFARTRKKQIIIYMIAFILFYIISIISLYPFKSSIYSAYNLYYKINNEIKTVETFGIMTYTRIDIKRVLFGFEETINTYEEPTGIENEIIEIPEKETYNEISINFEELINNESNATIKNILTYFKETKPTNKNEYTGMFEGKNLIFILAEGFNMIAVDKEITPTLYKLTTEGFVFNNFYSPVFLSTTGGEFQATTGMIPTQEILSNWKKYTPTIKYAIGNSFKEIGYNVQSYHNWTYKYYSRQKTMPTLGFDKYMGCGNGLEKLMNCSWLPSDIDMISSTLPLYKDYDKFATYYVSVSGHAPYLYNSDGNTIALKNIDVVRDLPYSNNVKAYLATQVEFDRALEALINGLEEAGILEETVISFVGDHYPYTLTMDEINELSAYKRDGIVEVNKSNFVIWNSEMDSGITIDKVGSQIDVLPTLLNLFGIEFDSRLIVGKDILSNEQGVAIFSNRSWVSDYGTYKNGNFKLKEGKTLENEQEYIAYMNNLVSTKFTLSSQIIKYNMYKYIFN